MTDTKTLQVSCVQLHWAQPLERNLRNTLDYIGRAAAEGSRVVLFPEATLTGYYFPYLVTLPPDAVRDALAQVCRAAAAAHIWTIVGSIQQMRDRYLNLMHVIAGGRKAGVIFGARTSESARVVSQPLARTQRSALQLSK